MSYWTAVYNWSDSFSHIQFEHVSRAQNKDVGALPTLTFKIDAPDEAIDLNIIKATLVATATDLSLLILLTSKIRVPPLWINLAIFNCCRELLKSSLFLMVAFKTAV